MSGRATGRFAIWACLAAPVLIGVDQVAALWAENAWQVTTEQAARTLVAVALFAAVGPMVLLAARARTLFYYNLATLFVYVALHWRGFKDAARYFDGLLPHGKELAYVAFGLLAIGLIAWAYLKGRGFARFALLFAALLLTSTVVQVSSLVARPTAAEPRSLLEPVELPLDRAPAAAALPDIVYIVPDRYGGPAVLKEFFGFDDGRFVAALRARGFYVAARAHANYLKTFQSLASMLNMQHLDHLTRILGAGSGDRRPVFRLIRDNLVVGFLKELGYRYVHLGSWWDPAKHNRHADAEFYGSGNAILAVLSNFDRAFLERTIFDDLVDRMEEDDECLRLKRQLEFLKTAGDADNGPTFVFAHLTIPHSPVTMDAQGRCIEPIDYPQENVSWRDFRKAHAGYVSYLNGALLAIFDARAGASRRPLIFVIQADEGPFPKRYQELEEDMDWFAATNAELRMKFGILNAIYFSDEDYGRFSETLTPVNNFRLIFSNILDFDMPLLGDRSFVFRNESRVYDFREIPPEVLVGQDGR